MKSVSFAGEVVIVDCGSTDRTEDIARQFGARWFVETWKGYGPQKNSALEKCLHDWVLILDADERVPEETALKIAELLSGQRSRPTAIHSGGKTSSTESGSDPRTGGRTNR